MKSLLFTKWTLSFLAFSTFLTAPVESGAAEFTQGETAFAPQVPAPITRKEPANLTFTFQPSEEKRELAAGVTYEFWSFNGHTPGPFIRVRVGDTFQVILDNTKGKLTHTIDFHAVTGPGGGAAALMTNAGEIKKGTFKAMNPGLYIYHCAAPPIPAHISNGLYGLILVEPAEGLPKVDREYYVLQSEFYTSGSFGEQGFQPFSAKKGEMERPDYVVFNGHTEALMGKNALQAKVGERVRLFVGNMGPNLVSSFHVIGEIFDNVYREGSVSEPEHNIQTTLIPAGSASIVDFKVEVPGDYLLVDHAIFRIGRGAVGILHAEGQAIAADIYSPLTTMSASDHK
jgi:nitrite reductase (NO-forming)